MTSKKDDQSRKKLLAYIKETFKEKPFISRVKEIRKQFMIPDDGFKKEENHIKWHHKLCDGKFPDFEKTVKILGQEITLSLPGIASLLSNFITQDIIDFRYIDDGSLIICRDIAHSREMAHMSPVWSKYKEAEDEFYPIAIMINPQTSQRDLLDFIRKNYTSHVKPQLDAYKENNTKLGSVQNKPSEEVYEFIYQNRSLSLNEIAEKLGQQYKLFFDVGHISSIIRIERARRKEV